MARIVFMGTPTFAVPTLQGLMDRHDVCGVVTQPDRRAGRGSDVRVPPVKVLAQAHDIPVIQPSRLREPGVREWLAERQADLFIVAAFGQILPQRILDLPRAGCLNVHGSLLPRWRGAAPIQAAIRAGDAETGITIMQMDAGLDTGPMLTKASTPIHPDDTGASLHDRMALIGARLLIETIPGYLDGTITPQPQDERLATLAPPIDKSDGHIDWHLDAAAIERTIRAFTPWPGTFTHWDGRLLKILRADVLPGSRPPGSVAVEGDALLIGTGAGLLRALDVQLEGRRRVAAEEFLRGHPAIAGAVLG